MNVLKSLVNSQAQSVQTLSARQTAPMEQLQNLWSLLVAWNTSSAVRNENASAIQFEEARDRAAIWVIV